MRRRSLTSWDWFKKEAHHSLPEMSFKHPDCMINSMQHWCDIISDFDTMALKPWVWSYGRCWWDCGAEIYMTILLCWLDLTVILRTATSASTIVVLVLVELLPGILHSVPLRPEMHFRTSHLITAVWWHSVWSLMCKKVHQINDIYLSMG